MHPAHFARSVVLFNSLIAAQSKMRMPSIMTENQNTNSPRHLTIQEVVGKARNVGSPVNRIGEMKSLGIRQGSVNCPKEGRKKAIRYRIGSFPPVVAEDAIHVLLNQTMENDARVHQRPKADLNSPSVIPTEGSQSSSASLLAASASPTSSSCKKAGSESSKCAARTAR